LLEKYHSHGTIDRMPKQVRFMQLIKSFGRPYPATLWAGNPDKDPEFKKAISENRILTVHTVNVGTKKDAAEIGFVKEGNPTYLIFPKPISMVQGTKVIGLKFDQLENPPVKDPVKISEAPPKKINHEGRVEKRAAQPPTEPVAPKQHVEKMPRKAREKAEEILTFEVTLKLSATVQRNVRVRAKTAAEARRAATNQFHKIEPKKPVWKKEDLDVKLTK